MSTQTPQRSTATAPLIILLTILGGAILTALILGTLFSTGLGLNRGTTETTADANGITSIEIEASATRFQVEFAPVDHAILVTKGTNASGWELLRDGNTLTVEAPDWWLGGWCMFGCRDEANTTTLTLPEELNDGNLSAYLELNSGRLAATGNFDVLDVELNAGEAQMQGSATTLVAEVNAGAADLVLENVDNADFGVSAGRLTSDLTGTAPTSTTLEVSAGQLVLTVPDTAYQVTSQVSAGSLDNRLAMDPSSSNHVDVELSAGNVILQPGEALVP